MSIQVYPADSRFTSNHGWLVSKFSFSFAEYYDPQNVRFGVMRVLNDDIVQPGKGFGAHPHREMEIVSIVLKGQLQHQDSTGQTAVTEFGGVQRMSAGTGVIHSEMNPSDTEEVNFLQMWFEPDTRGLPPSYQKTTFQPEKMKGELLPVVSKRFASEEVAYIHQDLTIFLSDLEAGESVQHAQEPDRKRFVFVIEGSVVLGDGKTKLGRRDSARITNLETLDIQAAEPSRLMLIDLP